MLMRKTRVLTNGNVETVLYLIMIWSQCVVTSSNKENYVLTEDNISN